MIVDGSDGGCDGVGDAVAVDDCVSLFTVRTLRQKQNEIVANKRMIQTNNDR